MDAEAKRTDRELPELDPPWPPWRPGRLQARFLLVTSLILVGVSGTLVFLFHRLSVSAVERARFRAASDVAESIALRLSAGIPETPVLDKVLSEYVHDNSEIVAVAVNLHAEVESHAGMAVDGHDELVEAFETSASVSRIVDVKGERLWSVAVPVVREGESIGAVGVWSTLRASELLTRETRRLAFVLLPLSIGILVVFLSIFFRRQVYLPLQALGSAMVRAESGETNAEAEIWRDDEIGFIAARYNRMLATIGRTQNEREQLVQKLQDFNEELSKRVKEATSELEDRNVELERLNRELYHLQRRLVRIERESVAEHMTARVAHKIGTPLNLISGHVQLLKKSRVEDDALQEKLALIESQIDKLTSTVREILDETRRTSFQMARVDLRALLQSTSSLLEPTLRARGVELDLQLGESPIEIEGDEGRLEQVFLTLIHNSLDAMPDGGHLSLDAESKNDSIEVRLADDGVGIPGAILPSIFKPFFTTKAPGRGTGLGLSIVAEILTAHRADIRVESTEGAGATFIMTFPRPDSTRARR